MLRIRYFITAIFALLFVSISTYAADEIVNETSDIVSPTSPSPSYPSLSEDATTETLQDSTAATKAAEATQDAVLIDGDKVEFYLDRNIRAIGDAVIRQNDKTISGDIIRYDVQNDQLDVKGNAAINVGNAKISGASLQMQLSDESGEMVDASINLYKPVIDKKPGVSISSEAFAKSLGSLQSQQIGGVSSYSIGTSTKQTSDTEANSYSGRVQATSSRGDAKAILFEGQDTKRLTEARYTTCAAGVEDWYIKAKDLEINDFSESGVARNAYIEFKGVPILYSPWVGFSFNNQRKTGLLAPSFDTSTKTGFGIATPFYWNISPNMDATFGVRALSKRGVQLQGEFRYLQQNFSGIDNLEFLPSDLQNDKNRYYANLKHQHNLGRGWSAGYSIEKVSDDQYFSDLSTRIITTSRVNLPQQFNVDYSDETWRFNALAQKFQTLDQISYPYERLPQLTLNGNHFFGDFNTNLYTQFVSFDTNNQAPVAVTGTRFTVFPSVSMPINRAYGFLIPKIGIHHTNYSLNDDPFQQNSASRTLPILSLDSGLFFDRDFKIAKRAYSQTLEPRLFYTYIPFSNQSKLPVFDTSESDLNFSTLFSENQYAGNDRINNANQISLSFTTRFIESGTGTQRMAASIGQRYYFADQKVGLPGASLRDNNSSDIIASLTTNLKTKWNLDAFWQYNTDDSKSMRTTIMSRYNPEPGKALNLSYSYRRDSIDQFDVSAQWPLKNGWYGVGRVNYSLREKQLIESIAGLEYNAGCWQARAVLQRIETATADANYNFLFQLELGGLASIGNNPLAVITRSVPGYVSTGLIPETYQQPYYE